MHSGVQFCTEIGGYTADILTATLLMIACSKPLVDLSKVRIDVPLATQQIYSISLGKTRSLQFDIATSAFCKGNVVTVALHCICFLPWIDGSTSATIYGKNQKDYNLYQCYKCLIWFHPYCLKEIGARQPKKTAEYMCHICEIPPTLHWGDKNYVNTCTVDNFLTCLLLHCKEYPHFLSNALGNSDVDNVLRTGMKLMLPGNLVEGRHVVLQHVSSRINLPSNGNIYDCYGNEHSLFLSIFKNISRVHVIQRCTSEHCPVKCKVTRSLITFSYCSPAKTPFDEQICNIFPVANDLLNGYCGAEFHGRVPPMAESFVCDRLDEDGVVRVSYNACGGVPRILQASFMSRNPWMIVINISKLSGAEVLKLPGTIHVYGVHFELAGCSLHSPGHFTAILNWHRKKFYYDDLGATKEQRLVAVSMKKIESLHGSYAYYFITISH